MSASKRIFVFCNSRCGGRGDWHHMIAIAEDGVCLAEHLCSHHGFARHDMGIDETGWKRDLYAKHHPEGFEVAWIEPSDVDTHDGLRAALAATPARPANLEHELLTAHIGPGAEQWQARCVCGWTSPTLSEEVADREATNHRRWASSRTKPVSPLKADDLRDGTFKGVKP